MKADQVGTGIGKGSCQGVHRLHHQVHINGHGFAIGSLGMRLEGLANHGAKGEIGYVMVVHHVVVNPVGASGNHMAHFFTQTGEIG